VDDRIKNHTDFLYRQQCNKYNARGGQRVLDPSNNCLEWHRSLSVHDHCNTRGDPLWYMLGLLRFYYSISGSVSVGFSQKTMVSGFPVSVFT